MRGCEKTSRFFITFSGLFRLVASFAQLSRTSSGSEKSSHIYRVEFSTFQTLIFTPSNFLPSPKTFSHFPPSPYGAGLSICLYLVTQPPFHPHILTFPFTFIKIESLLQFVDVNGKTKTTKTRNWSIDKFQTRFEIFPSYQQNASVLDCTNFRFSLFTWLGCVYFSQWKAKYPKFSASSSISTFIQTRTKTIKLFKCSQLWVRPATPFHSSPARFPAEE